MWGEGRQHEKKQVKKNKTYKKKISFFKFSKLGNIRGNKNKSTRIWL